MLPLLVDHDFNADIVRGLRRRFPALDAVRLAEVGPADAADPDVLELAAALGRVLISHDVNTMSQHARRRIASGRRCTGLILVPQVLPYRHAINELHLIVECTSLDDWRDRIAFIPL